MARLFAIGVLAVSLLLLYCGARMLPAGVDAFQARVFLDDWRGSRAEPSERAWAVAHAAAQGSVDWYPVARGSYLERLGLVLQWKNFRQPFGDASAEPRRREALAVLRAAVEARPTWPPAYVDLAWIKLYLLELDDEFDQALALAGHYGSSRLAINRQRAEISFLAWPHLRDEQRAEALIASGKVLAYSPREAAALLAIANDNGLLDEVCDSLAAETRQTHGACKR